jgi:hypothetical protein
MRGWHLFKLCDPSEMDNYAALPGPKLASKNNLRLFYVQSGIIFLILILILSITGYTGVVVSTVHTVSKNTQVLIDDVHALIPEAETGIELLRLLCENKNFTTHYSNIQGWCNRTLEKV